MKQQKFLSTLLAFAMILSMVPPSLAVELTGWKVNDVSYGKVGLNVYTRELAISDSGHFMVRDSDNNTMLSDLNGTTSVWQYQNLEYLNHDYFNATNEDYTHSIVNSSGVEVYSLGRDKEVCAIGDYLWVSSSGFADPDLESVVSMMNRYGADYIFFNGDFQEVSVYEALAGHEMNWGKEVGIYETSNWDADPSYRELYNNNGYLLMDKSESQFTYSYMSGTKFDLNKTIYYKDHYVDHNSTVVALHRTWNDVKTTTFVDYEAGEVYGTMEGHVSTINSSGYYVKEESDGLYGIYQTNGAYWLTGEAPPQTEIPEVAPWADIPYAELPNAVAYTSYLTGIYDVNTSTALVDGALPRGVGLYEDGVIGGVPMESGQFDFVVETANGYACYSLTVEEPTAFLVEKNNDFEIIERVPTVDNNEDDQIFQVSGEYGDFLNLYLNGELLVRDVHYFVSEGSTVLTVLGQTMSQLNSGNNTINATFAQTNTTVTPSASSGSTSSSGAITTNTTSQSANVASVAQVFNKTVEPEPLMAMPFTDVAVSDWHYQYVRYMYDTGTFYGITDTTYEPNTGMTRAMMAVVFYGMANKPSTGSANFSDVVDGEWYADAVNWISTSGIDDSVGTFRPTEMITREETAKMMHNFCTDQGIYIPITTSRTPNDMDSVSDNAKNAVNVLFSKGIFAGDNWDNFNPHNTSTRAEISAMMRTFMWATV